MMPTVQDVSLYLDEFAPVWLAEDWDNVGLLIGDPGAEVTTAMTCLTLTPDVVAEAIDEKCGLVITHHPLPFRPVKKITTTDVATRMVWQLIRAGVSVYSPHTGYDSAERGINQVLAERLQWKDIVPLLPNDVDTTVGTGRTGRTADATLGHLVERIKKEFAMETLKIVGELSQEISLGTVACGSGGSLLAGAIEAGSHVFVTGESSFHSCLEARSRGVAMVLMGHFSSERFALELLAEALVQRFPDLACFASHQESDPVSFV